LSFAESSYVRRRFTSRRGNWSPDLLKYISNFTKSRANLTDRQPHFCLTARLTRLYNSRGPKVAS
jgi:hypothetical protein